MFASLDILPLEGARSPMHLPGQVDILQRPVDPDCEAGARMWDLYNASKAPGRIVAHLGDFQLRSATKAGYAALPLGRSLGSAGRGAGLLVMADLSCLVFRTRDRKPWARGPEPHRAIEFLPIVLRLSGLLPYGMEHVVIPALDAGQSGPEIAFQVIAKAGSPVPSTEDREIVRALTAQLCWEATAWGNMLDDIPALSPDGVWPAAFPFKAIDGSDLDRFREHATRAARYILDKERASIRGLMVRIVSGRPLQGGMMPARLSLRLDSAGQDVVPAHEHDRICARLSRLVFRGEFAADRLLAQHMREEATSNGKLDRVQLATFSANGPLSNHERLELTAIFGNEDS